MNCKLLCSCCGIALAAAIVLTPSVVFSADQSDKAKDALKDAAKGAKDTAEKAVKDAKKQAEDMMGGHQMSPEEMQAMKNWEEYSTPNEHHKMLASWAGEWDLVMKWWQFPGMPPTENKATASSKAIMGGRFVVEKVTGTLIMGEGMPPADFEGMAVMGYDNAKKMHFSTWIDNMGTGIMMDWGTCSDDMKTITTKGEMYDPMEGKSKMMRSVSSIIDADTRKMEMFGPGPDGKEFKTMEIVYTRKK